MPVVLKCEKAWDFELASTLSGLLSGGMVYMPQVCEKSWKNGGGWSYIIYQYSQAGVSFTNEKTNDQ